MLTRLSLILCSLAIGINGQVFAGDVSDASIQGVFKAAVFCTDKVVNESNGKVGSVKLASIPYGQIYSEKVGGLQPFAYSRSELQWIPYVESTSMDGGQPRSAWKECMRSLRMPTP